MSGIAVEVNNHTRYAVDEAAVEALAAAVLAAEGVAGELGDEVDVSYIQADQFGSAQT